MCDAEIESRNRGPTEHGDNSVTGSEHALDIEFNEHESSRHKDGTKSLREASDALLESRNSFLAASTNSLAQFKDLRTSNLECKTPGSGTDQDDVSASAVSYHGYGPLERLRCWRRSTERSASWFLLFCSILPINLLLGADFISFSLYYVAYAQSFPDENRSTIGAIVAIKETVACVFGLVTSVLITRYGCRAVTVAGGTLLSASLIVSSLTPNIAVLYVTQGLLSGIACSFCVLTPNYLLHKNFDRNRALAGGASRLGSTLGNIAGVSLTECLIRTYGWRGSLVLQAGLAAHIVPLGLAMSLPRSSRETDIDGKGPSEGGHASQIHTLEKGASDEVETSQIRDADERGSKEEDEMLQIRSSDVEHGSNRIKGEDVQTSRSKRCVKFRKFVAEMLDFSLFKSCIFVLVSFGVMCDKVNTLTFMHHMPSRAVYLGLSRAEGASLMSACTTTILVCRTAVTFLANLSCMNRVLLYSAGCFVGTLSSFLLVAVPSFQGQVLGSVVSGIHVGITYTLTWVILADLIGMGRFARAMALQDLVGIAGYLAAPVGGYVYDLTESYDLPFIISGTFGVLGGSLILAAAILDILSRKENNNPMYNVISKLCNRQPNT